MRKPATNLRIARTRAGYSQQEVAELLGVARTTILRWERGSSPVPIYGRNGEAPAIDRLAALYGVSREFLVGWRPTSEEFAELEARGAA